MIGPFATLGRPCAKVHIARYATIEMVPEQFKTLFEAKAKHWGALTAFGDRLQFPGPPNVAADSFCQSLTALRLRKLGDSWIDFERIPRHSRYRWIDPAVQLARRLEQTLAYSETLFERADAEQLAQEFFGMFRVGAIVRLTTMLGPHAGDGGAHAWSGHPITEDYTFGHAYVAMDDAIIGLVLLFDED